MRERRQSDKYTFRYGKLVSVNTPVLGAIKDSLPVGEALPKSYYRRLNKLNEEQRQLVASEHT